MKSVLALLCFFSAMAASAHSSFKNLEHVLISGSEYIRIAEWADGSNFTMKWAKNEEGIALSGAAGRVQFTVDSRRAEIGGVNVWLSLPVVNRMGVALLSLIDLRTVIEPILFPHHLETPLKTICLDPGHGGKDSGKTERHNYEKKYSLLLAQDVSELLNHDGFKVVLTRDSDRTVELPERAAVARREGADVFISLHYNAAETDLRGLEVYCLTPAGMNSSNDGGGKAFRPAESGNAQDDRNVLLAYELQKSITTSVPLEDRGMKRARFEVLRETSMPAILIEGGFMTNPYDARNIYDSSFRKRMARAIVDGILSYKKQTERL